MQSPIIPNNSEKMEQEIDAMIGALKKAQMMLS